MRCLPPPPELKAELWLIVREGRGEMTKYSETIDVHQRRGDSIGPRL